MRQSVCVSCTATAVYGGKVLNHAEMFCPYRVCPQGSDDFGQRQLPKLLHIRSVYQTLCGVKDMILHNKEAGDGGKTEGVRRKTATESVIHDKPK